MPLRSLPPGDGAAVPEFDPDAWAIRVTLDEEHTLLLSGDSHEMIRSYTATVHHAEDEAGEPAPAASTIRFSHVAFGTVGGDGFSLKSDFADAISGELLEIADSLFSDEGLPRDELKVEAPFLDVLHFEFVEVAPGGDVHGLVRHALEHILARYSNGCGMAAFYQANWESIGVARPLRDRGFRQTPSNRNVWFLDLGRNRPPLSAEAADKA